MLTPSVRLLVLGVLGFLVFSPAADASIKIAGDARNAAFRVNAKGYATAVVQPYSNGTGATLPIGTIVSLKASYDDRRVVAAPTEDGTEVLGVVVGSYEDDDGVTFTSTDPSDHGTVAVGRERRTLKGFLGGAVVPAVRIEGWTFTGTTEH